jgi:predicted XRE-type DNA-binding protein
MTSKEIVNNLMRTQGVSNAEMAAKLNLTQAALWDRLNPKKTNNMTVKKFNEMLKMLDYKIVAVPRKTRLPEGGFEVD